MTPFAAEISRNISRYLRNKVPSFSAEKFSGSSDICQSMGEYLMNLYPSRVLYQNVHGVDSTLFVLKHAMDVNGDDDNEIIPIIIIYHPQNNIINIQRKKTTIDIQKYMSKNDSMTIQYDDDKSDTFNLTIEKAPSNSSDSKFWEAMNSLKLLIQDNSDINDGFVCFITNDSSLWMSSNKEEDLYTTRIVAHNKITLFPMMYSKTRHRYTIPPCQAVWLPTRHKDYNFCLGMYNDAFRRHDYQCKIRKKLKASKYALQSHIPFPENSNDAVVPTVEQSFYRMLNAGRFINSSKKDWLWEWESPILNDYSRLMMSSAIRRMKDKTQVFSFEESDFSRVRLTHSLEVANIAKLIGLGVEYNLKNGYDINTGDEGLKHIQFDKIGDYHIPQILEVAGLIHDIGNPPYGHFGERTIQQFFSNPNLMHPEVRQQFEQLTHQQQLDFINFDGNVQGFRILRHLGLSTDCSSFNLNKVVLSTLVKYPYSSERGNIKDDIDCRKHKFGYFQMEEDAFSQMRQSLGLKEGQRHPLAYLLEAADDICYMGSDIEDGWKLKYIPAHEITEAFNQAFTEAELDSMFKTSWSELSERIEHTDNIISAMAVQSLRIRMQRYMVKEVIDFFCQNIERIILDNLADDQHELLKNIPNVHKIHDVWKKLVHNCYNQIHCSQIQGGQIITALLKAYTEAVFCGNLVKHKKVKTKSADFGDVYVLEFNNDDKSGMIYETISDNYRYELSPAGQFMPEDAYSKFMLVTDCVSGMTDYYASNKYKELMI